MFLPLHAWPRSLHERRRKRVTHSAFGEKSHTAAYTAKHGLFRMGVVSLPSIRAARSRISPGRVSERRTLPLLGLGRGCSQRTQRAFGTAMRLCASLFRGVAAPLGCVIFLQFGDVAVFSLCAQYFLNVRGRGVLLPSACFACSRNAGRPLAKAANLPFSEVGWSSLIPVAQKQKQHLTANSPDPRERNRGCFFRHFMERARNAAICALVQVALGANRSPPTPWVIPLSTAQATACA